MSAAQDRARGRNWFLFQVRGAIGNLDYAAIRGALTEAERADLDVALAALRRLAPERDRNAGVGNGYA